MSPIHAWEDHARHVQPDSPEYHALVKGYMQALRDDWARGPLEASTAAYHDSRRTYPAKFCPMSLPNPGTQAWRHQALKAGVQLDLIETAPARVELVRMADAVITKHGGKAAKYDTDTLVDVIVSHARGQESVSQLDRAIEHLQAIVRKARELGFYTEGAA